jgi:hypothetical protein
MDLKYFFKGKHLCFVVTHNNICTTCKWACLKP